MLLFVCVCFVLFTDYMNSKNSSLSREGLTQAYTASLQCQVNAANIFERDAYALSLL